MSNVKRVAGMIANKNGITLYLEDGSTTALDMTEWKTEQIVAGIAPALSRMEIAEIDLDGFTRGVIQDAIKAVPGLGGDENALTIKHRSRELSGEAIKSHVEDIAFFGRSAKGFKNFMRHFQKQTVNHSADELLEFMKVGKMPLADDGSIIGFKILNFFDLSKDKDTFVDVHTRTVKQKLGSLVYMPRCKVSDDRRQACGTGLHVAAPAYASSFGGDVMTLVKVRPHDVVRVPRNENTKMGCSAYQIVAVLDDDQKKWVRNGKPLQKHETGLNLLAEVVAGNHPPISTKTEVGSFGLERPTDKLRAAGQFEETKPVMVKTETKSKKKPKKANPEALSRKNGGLSVRQIKDMIEAAKSKKPAKRSASEQKLLDYQKKYEKAKALIAKGMNLREAAAQIGIDRNVLSDNLKAGR